MGRSIEQIVKNDVRYPELLGTIPGPPEALFVLGTFPAPAPAIAIVGTRKATTEGKRTAYELARALSERGMTVVSGLALGIDAAAHEGALAGGGRTVAVLANGLDQIYPRVHERLAEEILARGGAIVSEYPSGTPPLPHRFLERNRIVSGLSIGVILVEVPIHSGALVTARHALDQGREVFVVPGPARHPNFRGSHLLIRNGARLATSPEDIFEDLTGAYPETAAAATNSERGAMPEDEASRLIIGALRGSRAALTRDELIAATKLEPHVVAQRLTFLTFDGKAVERNGKFEAA